MTKNDVHPLFAQTTRLSQLIIPVYCQGSTNAVEAGSTEAMLPSSYPWHEEPGYVPGVILAPVQVKTKLGHGPIFSTYQS